MEEIAERLPDAQLLMICGHNQRLAARLGTMQRQAAMYVEGFSRPLTSALQLPDPTEPRGNGDIAQFLDMFGRGTWFLRQPSTRSSVIQLLYFMNDSNVVFRTFGNRYFTGSSLVAQVAASGATDEEAVRQLTLSILGREPVEREKTAAIKAKRFPRQDWLADVAWALLNHVDFMFNY